MVSVIRTWTQAECIEQIDALEAELVTLRSVPRSGRVGNTQIDLGGNVSDVREAIDLWRARLSVAAGNGRGRWGC